MTKWYLQTMNRTVISYFLYFATLKSDFPQFFSVLHDDEYAVSFF